jgi:hypothetical protein
MDGIGRTAPSAFRATAGFEGERAELRTETTE